VDQRHHRTNLISAFGPSSRALAARVSRRPLRPFCCGPVPLCARCSSLPALGLTHCSNRRCGKHEICPLPASSSALNRCSALSPSARSARSSSFGPRRSPFLVPPPHNPRSSYSSPADGSELFPRRAAYLRCSIVPSALVHTALAHFKLTSFGIPA
jgi:hypothetical protein